LRHRTQKNYIEKQCCNYYIDVSKRFRFSAHAVKIRISVICCFAVKWAFI
jgi:hypothetical protein